MSPWDMAFNEGLEAAAEVCTRGAGMFVNGRPLNITDPYDLAQAIRALKKTEPDTSAPRRSRKSAP